MKVRRRLLGLVAALVLALVTWWVQGSGPADQAQEPSSQTAEAEPDGSGVGTALDPVPGSDLDPRTGIGLDVVAEDDLPVEAQATLELIDDGGPFAYERDGLDFENREELLPEQPMGYYAEYTVPTPGAHDRGARRIVAGDGGDFYYTSDHYRSFVEIDRG